MKAVVPVAGSGTRMYPLGVTTPKCLVPILNRPLILWTLEALKTNGVTDVVLVISAGVFGKKIREYIEQAVAEKRIKDQQIQFAVQEQQLGTAHVVQAAESFFQSGDEFLFLYGDDLYGPGNIAAILKTPGLAVTGVKVKDPEKWGIFQTNSDGTLQHVVEKPATFVGDLANIGCMKLDTRVFDLYKQLKVSPRGEYELTDTLQLLANDGAVTVRPSTDYWIPIGYPWHILEATETFMAKLETKIEGVVEDGVTIKGHVVLPKSSTIKAGTYIEGNVLIGENCVIGPSASLRDAVTIGDNSKIGFAVEVKNSVIGRGSSIPHLAYVGDSVIGENVNIAGQCMLANLRHDNATIRTPIKEQMVDTGRMRFGAILGDNVKLGAGTTIYPGRKIWPDRTTRPGEVVEKDIVG